jgi:hypothetical protein
MAELHSTTYLQAAAWVPDDEPKRPRDEAADLADDWMLSLVDASHLQNFWHLSVAGARVELQSRPHFRGCGCVQYGDGRATARPRGGC